MKEIFVHAEDMPKDCLDCSLRSIGEYPKLCCYAANSLIDDGIDKRSDLCPLKCIEDKPPKSILQQSKILFASTEHELFYNEQLSKCYTQDVYHRALMYTLGISENTRNHINEIYDFDRGCVKIKTLHSDWITSGDVCVMRLAFNLFTHRIPEDRNKERYAVSELFSHGYVEYLCQAIMIRYGML